MGRDGDVTGSDELFCRECHGYATSGLFTESALHALSTAESHSQMILDPSRTKRKWVTTHAIATRPILKALHVNHTHRSHTTQTTIHTFPAPVSP